MAVAVVRSSSGTTSAALTAALSFAATPAVGNLVVVCAHIDCTVTTPDVPATCTDNQGNTYTKRTNIGVNNSAAALVMQFTAPIVTAAGTFTVTLNCGNSEAWDTASFFWSISEISGHNTASPIDQVATNYGSSTAASVNAAAQQADTMVFGACGQEWDTALTPAANWTVIYGVNRFNSCYRIGDYDPSWTLGLSAAWGAACMGIAAAAAGGSILPLVAFGTLGGNCNPMMG